MMSKGHSHECTRMQARSPDVAQASAHIAEGSREYEWCNHTIAAKGHVQAGVCSTEVKAPACAGLHRMQAQSPDE